MKNKEPYDPIPDILEQFLWVLSNCKKYQGSPGEAKFRELGERLWAELLKYLTK